jgi:hypothetical protein
VNGGTHLCGIVIIDDDELDGVVPSASGAGGKEGTELLG